MVMDADEQDPAQGTTDVPIWPSFAGKYLHTGEGGSDDSAWVIFHLPETMILLIKRNCMKSKKNLPLSVRIKVAYFGGPVHQRLGCTPGLKIQRPQAFPSRRS